MDAHDVIIQAEGLTKRYGDTTAVRALDLEVRQGEVFGLLGPNGAGKTTTILMLLGLSEPSSWNGPCPGPGPGARAAPASNVRSAICRTTSVSTVP